MILNSAIIERYLIDGKTYEDTKEFIDALLACDDLVADVYVNYKRVASGPLSLSVNNSWIIANVDERMSITNIDDSAYVINIVVHQFGCNELEDVIMKSTSPLSTFIDPGDIDADLYFAVMATVPECTQECHVPESVFNMMGTDNIVPKDFTDNEQCPTDPTVPEPEPEMDIKLTYMASVPGDTITWMLLNSDGTPYGDNKSECDLDFVFKYHGEVTCEVHADSPMFDTNDGKFKSSVTGDASGVTFDLTDNLSGKSWKDMPISNE